MGRQPLPTDTILGNGSDQYRIDTVLGPGGFGITYLARDLRFDRDVAVKEYFPAEFAYREGTTTVRSLTRGSHQNFFEQGKRQFLDEARTLAKFRHEHIVRVLNLFEQFNTAYMVLEFEEGQSFRSWLRSLGRRPTQAEIDDILDPLLAALQTVHAKGLFHRDIAPDNIIIRPDGKPVLIDFGAARQFVRENSHTLGAIVKHGYSPPEQYTLDTKLQGAWSDIYSLSATIYAALMGQPPEEASRRQLNDTVLPVAAHLDPQARGRYRPSFLAALDAGLALKPKDRPQTVEELAALLEKEDPRPAASDALLSGEVASQTSATGLRNGSGFSQSRGVGSAFAVALARDGALPAVPADIASEPYPELAMRIAGAVALALAALSAFAFLSIGGISHPGGLGAAMLVCAGLVGASLERTVAVSRADSDHVEQASAASAVMAALALAVFWLPFFFWQLSVLFVVFAAAFASMRFGRWVPFTMFGLALVHLALAALLMALAARSVQKDPYFLPLMGASLALIAGLMLASSLHIQRRWEPPSR